MLVIPVAENLLPGMARGTILLKRRFLFRRARHIPQQFRAAELAFNLRRGRQRIRIGNPLQHDVVQLGSSINVNGIYDVRLEEQRSGDPQSVVPGLHLGEFVVPLRVGIHGRPDAIWRDELHADAFRRIPAR